MARKIFTAGDVTGLYTLGDTDHLYPAHVNELRQGAGHTATVIVGTSLNSAKYTDIQTAINALPAGGGEVFIQEGTYVITANIVIPSNTRIRGCGWKTILYVMDNMVYPGWNLLVSTSTENIEICDLMIDGNAENNGGGATITPFAYQFHSVTNLNIHDTFLYNIAGHPTDIANCSHVSFKNNWITSPDSVYGSVVFSDMNDLIIEGNHIYNQHGKGIGLYGTPSSWIGRTNVSNNVIYDCGYGGILSVAPNAIIKGNNIVNVAAGRNGAYGIHLDSGNGAISGVVIEGNNITGGKRNGIYVMNDCKYIVINGNIVKNVGSDVTEADWYREGIHLHDTADLCTINNNIVVNSGYGNAGTNTIAGIGNDGYRCVMNNNTCTDDQGTKTQSYGIRVYRDANHNIIGNYCLGNAVSGISHPAIVTNIIEHNQE